jgi:uncharacterized protein with GYD domain
MPCFALLIRNDQAGSSQMLMSGEEGAADQALALDCYDAHVRFQCGLLGHYDALIVADFPSQEAAAAFSLAVSAHGQYVEALPALLPSAISDARRLYIEATNRLVEKKGVAPPHATDDLGADVDAP